MQQLNSRLFRYGNLSEVNEGSGRQRLSVPLPTGTLVHVAWRMVDAGDQKASNDMPYISHGENGDKPLRMNIFAEILGGPHAGQGWYENILLPADIQERCGKSLTQGQRTACEIGARTLKHMLLSSRGQPFSTTEGLDQVDFAAFGGLMACVKTKINEFRGRDGELISNTVIGEIIDPTDPRCAQIRQAGELTPQGQPATAAAPAPAPTAYASPAPAAPAPAPAPMAYAAPAPWAAPAAPAPNAYAAQAAYAAPTAYSAPAVTPSTNGGIGPGDGDDEIPF